MYNFLLYPRGIETNRRYCTGAASCSGLWGCGFCFLLCIVQPVPQHWHDTGINADTGTYSTGIIIFICVLCSVSTCIIQYSAVQ
jgi:hypothetical protein